MTASSSVGNGKAGVRVLRVLLAEDDAVSQAMVRGLLERQGHFVKVVSNGSEAVEEMDRARYDVVLMDIQMPVMDGFQATKEIRERERAKNIRTPIIAFSALEFSVEFRQVGMDGYVGKPANSELLLAAITATASAAKR